MSQLEQTPHFAMLANLSDETSSEGRRDVMRKVSDALDQAGRAHSEADIAQVDALLASIASEYSVQVRTQIARLVSGNVKQFCRVTNQFAMDDIAVARPILEHSAALSEDTLLAVVRQKSQDHLMAVTKRHSISANISHALVEHGDDHVVTSLLVNERAEIDHRTYEAVTDRAQNSPMLQAPLVRRAGVPIELLNELYLTAEANLRQEITDKFRDISPEDMEKAFARSRSRVTSTYKKMPADFDTASRRIDQMNSKAGLVPPVLMALLREGKASRTAFKIAFARLTDVDFDLVERVIEANDTDTIALLCRGANFERALFVAMAIGLDSSERAMARAEEFGRQYERVPVQAAQRTLRFWKVRAAA